MRKIKMIIIFSVILLVSYKIYAAGDLSLGYGLYTTHIKFGNFCDDYDFVENNNIITLEYGNSERDIFGITYFKNSFGNDTFGIYVGTTKDKNNKGFYGVYRFGVSKGYNSEDYLPSKSVKNMSYGFNNKLVFYDDYGLLLTFGIGYQVTKNISLETNIISNAIITNIKIRL